ncbi:MAG: hypothetical protein M1833_001682 [Piccolia ochrophora]|nr:MAG: hypothetical protein M1833_001682 [Piccolia ochrophora]
MAHRLLHPDEYEHLTRSSFDSAESFDLDDADPETQNLTSQPSYLRHRPRLRLPPWLTSLFPPARRRQPRKRHQLRPAKLSCLRRRGVRHLCYSTGIFLLMIFVLVIATCIFDPSYNNPPSHYRTLQQRITSTGNANPNGEQVYIAANIIDEALIRGAWGNAVLDLIDLLGPENVFLSIYENDSGPETTAALKDLERKVPCKSSIVSEHLPLEDIPKVKLPSGEQRVKRIAYLAEVRNRALRPLEGEAKDTKFDKLLFLNDIVFSPTDAAQLLFSTKAGSDGRTKYRAACAVDFINAFKFYDTYATRDAEGYSMGVPFFPWFSNAGSSRSRQDVLSESDAVHVRSCWGGMVAFEAKWFQEAGSPDADLSLEGMSSEDRNLNWHWNNTWLPPRREPQPVRFRSESDLFWEASECCLIHADIQPEGQRHTGLQDSGIYVNPYIRVAYDKRSFRWLQTTRRWERLYILPHRLVNWFAGLPFFNPRRTEVEGEEVKDRVWKVEEADKKAHSQARAVKGSWKTVTRTAGRGGFCGGKRLQVLKDNPRKGEKMWEILPVPPG